MKDDGDQYHSRVRTVSAVVSQLTGVPEDRLWPLSPQHAMLFLSQQHLLGNVYSTVSGYMAAINWRRQLMGAPLLADLPEGGQIRRLLDAIQRDNLQPVVGKLPITTAMLWLILRWLFTRSRHAGDHYHRTAVTSRLAHAGFNRIEEVLQLWDTDLVLDPARRFFDRTYFYDSSKGWTLQAAAHTPSYTVRISATGDEFCPVSMIANWISIRGLQRPGNPPRPLFPGSSLGAPVSYSTFRVQLLDAIDGIGYDSSLYGTHSLRIGPATEAYQAGVPIPEIQRALRHVPGSSSTFRYLPAEASPSRPKRTRDVRARDRSDPDSHR
jgi:hypothetical protein